MSESPTPGGRGPRRDKDGIVNQDETDALRRGTRRYDGWYLGVGDNNSLGVATTVDVANRVRLVPLDFYPFGFVLKRVGLVVDGPVAASTAQVGLYLYQREPKAQFILVSGSSMTLSCAGAGLIQATLTREVQVEPFTRLFIGSVFSDVNIAVAGHDVSSFRRTPILYIDMPSTALPSSLLRSVLTSDTSEPVPYVTYSSVEAVQTVV